MSLNLFTLPLIFNFSLTVPHSLLNTNLIDINFIMDSYDNQLAILAEHRFKVANMITCTLIQITHLKLEFHNWITSIPDFPLHAKIALSHFRTNLNATITALQPAATKLSSLAYQFHPANANEQLFDGGSCDVVFPQNLLPLVPLCVNQPLAKAALFNTANALSALAREGLNCPVAAEVSLQCMRLFQTFCAADYSQPSGTFVSED